MAYRLEHPEDYEKPHFGQDEEKRPKVSQPHGSECELTFGAPPLVGVNQRLPPIVLSIDDVKYKDLETYDKYDVQLKVQVNEPEGEKKCLGTYWFVPREGNRGREIRLYEAPGIGRKTREFRKEFRHCPDRYHFVYDDIRIPVEGEAQIHIYYKIHDGTKLSGMWKSPMYTEKGSKFLVKALSDEEKAKLGKPQSRANIGEYIQEDLEKLAKDLGIGMQYTLTDD